MTSIVEQITKDCPSGWEKLFENARPEIGEICRQLAEISGSFYPRPENIFKAFRLTKLSDVKVVLIGQDPYHQSKRRNPGSPRAQGLSFSVARDDGEIPSSLVNIFKEISEEYSDYTIPKHGDLTRWANQGVLLLNADLTVSPGQANSHKGRWYGFLCKVLETIIEEKPNTVFILLGANAQSYQKKLSCMKNATCVTAVHPSGLSANRGFFGSGVFVKTNELLEKKGMEPIDWQT